MTERITARSCLVAGIPAPWAVQWGERVMRPVRAQPVVTARSSYPDLLLSVGG
jgi:hypothetical protein